MGVLIRFLVGLLVPAAWWIAILGAIGWLVKDLDEKVIQGYLAIAFFILLGYGLWRSERKKASR